MCSASKAINVVLTQHHEQTMSDIGDALTEMQDRAFTLGYMQAQDEAAQEIANVQAKLASVPVHALCRHWWNSSKLKDKQP